MVHVRSWARRFVVGFRQLAEVEVPCLGGGGNRETTVFAAMVLEEANTVVDDVN